MISTGRAARDGAGPREVLGHGIRLAQMRGEAERAPAGRHEIDGLDIHFIHVRSQHAGRAAADRLARLARLGHRAAEDHRAAHNPPSTAGASSDAFEVVIPSLPGYGFSGKPAAAGWGPERIARAWAVLMERLGYTRYVAQGGDWGTAVTAAMARQAPAGLLGIHVNFAQMVRWEMLGHIRNGEPAPAGLSDVEKRAYGQVAFATYHRGYGVIQGTRPQTIGYSLADTPVGLAAWLLDHDTGTYEHSPGSSPDSPTAPSRPGLARQHLAVLAHEHRDVRGAAVLAASRDRQETSTPPPTFPSRRRSRCSGGVRARAAQLDRAGVPQPDLLQRGRKGRPPAAWEQSQLFDENQRVSFGTLR